MPFYCGTFMADMVDPNTPLPPMITGRKWAYNRGTLDNSPPVW